MIIDFHTHTFPDKIAAAAIQKMQGDCKSAAFTEGTVSALQASMKNANIDLSVVLPVATNPLKVSSINDISIASTEKDGLIYFGCIHPDAENYKDELRRIADAGIKGVKIHPVYQGVDIDDIRYLRILDCAGELGLIVLTHAGDDIGFPGVVRCSPKMIANALNQVGDVTFVAAHMGGWKNWEDIDVLMPFKHLYLDTAFSLGHITPLFDTAYTPDQLPLLSDEKFCKLIKECGSDRILFGTDSPWTDQLAEKEHLMSLPLSQEEKENIMGKNACRLLNINA